MLEVLMALALAGVFWGGRGGRAGEEGVGAGDFESTALIGVERG